MSRSRTASISPGDGLDAADGRRLEDHLDAGVGAVEALQVDRPLLLPREAFVGQLRDVGHRLADGNEALAEHLVAVAEADVAALERQSG